MRAFPAVVMGTIGIWASQPAFAACAAPYGSDALLEDLSTVESFLRNNDNEAASAAAVQMEGKIGCLNEVLPPMIMGRAYRAIGGGLYVGGNLTRSKDWFATSISIDPTFDYGTEDLPDDHPILLLYSDEKHAGVDDPVQVAGKSFVEGAHFIDGKKSSQPITTPGMPHIYQETVDGTTKTWLIEGVKFPDEVLTGASGAVASTTPTDGKAPKPPKPGKEPAAATTHTGLAAVTTIQRKRPAEKTPLMIAGSAIMAGAGGVYFMAAQSKAAFEDATTNPEVVRLKGKTDSLVVVSGIVLAVGTGALTWGVIVDDEGTPMPAIHVRF